MAKDYELQIAEFEKKVKSNVKKIQDLSGGNVLKKLIKNEKFRTVMQEKGCSLESLEQQCKL